jgi:hypothetical protein
MPTEPPQPDVLRASVIERSTSIIRQRGKNGAFESVQVEIDVMTVVQEYTQSLLVPQLRSLGLSKRQWGVVVEDVAQRLESLLSHWSDVPFRRTVLVLGTEEASFWRPQGANIEIRSLVVVAVRNSLIEDLSTSDPYTKILRSPKMLLPDARMPWITGEAINAFREVDLVGVQAQPRRDLFGELPRRFPNAWHVLSLLGNSSENEVACNLPMAESEPNDSSVSTVKVQQLSVVVSGIDPRLDNQLMKMLGMVKRGELDLFFSHSFKSITRNPEKLLSIIDYVLRYGGTVLTPNYLLSPTYLARRNPLLRPTHYTSDFWVQVTNSVGLSERHKELLASLNP